MPAPSGRCYIGLVKRAAASVGSRHLLLATRPESVPFGLRAAWTFANVAVTKFESIVGRLGGGR